MEKKSADINNVPIYILSTGRAGTTFLYKFFSEFYPELEVTHQTSWSRLLNIAGNLPLGLTTNARLVSVLHSILKRGKIPSSTVDPLLSVSICNMILTDRIKDYKVIHLVREPGSFAKSFMSWKSASVKRSFLHHILPFWQPSPVFHGPGLLDWLRMTKEENFLWIWNYKNSLFRHIEMGTSYKRIRMEDLTSSEGNEVWKDLITFLDLPQREIDFRKLSSRRENASPSDMNRQKGAGNEGDNSTEQKYCGPLSREFGY